jgi:hypothetical protein
MPEPAFEEEMKRVDYWLNELRSLGVPARRKNELNDGKELHDLADNIKQTFYQEYKVAYAEA